MRYEQVIPNYNPYIPIKKSNILGVGQMIRHIARKVADKAVPFFLLFMSFVCLLQSGQV